MNKFLVVSVLALMLNLSPNAQAKSPMGGGFTGPSVAAVSVVEAQKLGDDTPVVLVGSIEKSLGGEKYLFKDATGTIVVEIDDEDWNGVTVSETDVIEIRGEIDKDLMKAPKVDVDSIVKK